MIVRLAAVAALGYDDDITLYSANMRATTLHTEALSRYFH